MYINKRYVLSKWQFIVLSTTIFAFVFYIFFISVQPYDIKIAIQINSWLGWLLWAYCLFTWYKITGRWISLYGIFISFAILFNYGQCLMWALGIYWERDILNFPSWGHLINPISIYKAQMLSLMGICTFHCGAVINHSNFNNGIMNEYDQKDRETLAKNERKIKVLYFASVITMIISTLCTYYICILNISITKAYGYGANLYNETVTASQNNIIILLSWMFIPSIVALLLSSNYKKKVMIICYIVYLGYSILQLAGGDRGFVYFVCILIWMHHNYYRPINRKNILVVVVGIYILGVISVGLSKSRNAGVSLELIMSSIVGNNNPIASAFFEMGGNMKPAVVIIDNSVNYPYGNSYLLALAGMITERIIKLFNPSYIGLGGWFSQVYLGLKYGAGFSMIAEALINFGIYGAIFMLFVIGYLVGKITDIKRNDNTLITFFKISACSVMMSMVRGTSLSALKNLLFSTVSILIFVKIIEDLFDRRGF